MAPLDLQIKASPFFMPPGHFTMDQMYEIKINDCFLLFFPLAYGTEVNYCPFQDLSVLIIYQAKDTFQNSGQRV